MAAELMVEMVENWFECLQNVVNFFIPEGASSVKALVHLGDWEVLVKVLMVDLFERFSLCLADLRFKIPLDGSFDDDLEKLHSAKSVLAVVLGRWSVVFGGVDSDKERRCICRREQSVVKDANLVEKREVFILRDGC